jgi:phosphoglycolate phosphatase
VKNDPVSGKMNRIKGIIFDLDGTLINSIGGIGFSMNSVLEKNGMPTHSIDSYKTYVGNGIGRLVKRSLQESIAADTDIFSKVLDEMKTQYAQSWDYGMSLYDGVADLLSILSEHSIFLTINTNKPSKFLKPIVDKYLKKWIFSCIVGGTSLYSLKPDPEGALHILHTLGISPEECIYVGDSEVDITTAKNAGICSVSVAWGFRSESDLLMAGVQNIIRNPLELLHFLQIE